MRKDISQDHENCTDTEFNIDVENINININIDNTQPIFAVPETTSEMPDLFEV